MMSAMGGGTTEYAPYFYTWGWGNPAYAFTSLVDLKAKANLRAVTLAFVLSSNGCSAGIQEIEQHKDDIDEFRRKGGRIKASFGGANGTYLETTCSNATSLAQALKSFIDKTGITDLDFDVEQSGAMTEAINQRRAAALQALQHARPNTRVSFTLAALPRDRNNTPGGLSAAALEVVKASVAGGVAIHRVNLMTMDYGPYFSSGRSMGELTESALTDAHAQLRTVMPALTEDQAWGMLGATPMIGMNDVVGEVFDLGDAQRVARFARQKRLGLISFWAINRDQACTSGLAICSGKNRGTFDFHNIFKTVE
jgi:chitinase